MSIHTNRFTPLWVQGLAALGILLIAGWALQHYGDIDLERIRHIFFNIEVMEGQWGLLMSGLWITTELAVVSIILSTILGLLVAIFRIKENKIINVLLVGYLEFCRATPILVALIVVYFGLPFLNIRFSAFESGVIVIVFVHAAYIGEAFRSGIMAIHRTQTEASYALGMTPRQTLQYILVPQAFRMVLPSLANQWIGVIKDTAVTSLLAITELLKAAQIIATWKANPTPLVMSTFLYLLILIPLTILTMKLERNQKLTR
jgi:polar amino acid transport system permease protein